MSRVETVAEIRVYEVDGEKQGGLEQPKVTIRSHWNDRDWVTLQVPGGAKLALVAADLHAAIRAATMQP